MILAYKNVLKTSTLTPTSENGNYPVENLYHAWKKKIYKTADDVLTSTITVDFTEDENINSFFISYHNCTSIQVRFYDVSDSLIDTWDIENDRYHGDVTARYAEVVLTSPVTVYVGSIFLGQALSFEKEANQDIPINSTDSQTFSNDYQVAGRKGSAIRSGSVTIPGLSASERENLEDAFIECGFLTPFFMDLWESSPTVFDHLYGVFTSSLSITHRYDGDDVSFDFTEVN